MDSVLDEQETRGHPAQPAPVGTVPGHRGDNAVLERAGVEAGTAPDQAPAMARALCWMIERSFYHASQESREKLQQVSSTCEHIRLISAGLTA
ncbi:hypothetical protein ABGB01_35720 [Nonomuraea sp. B5E05]